MAAMEKHVDEEMAEKEKSLTLQLDKDFLNLFWKLSETNSHVRVATVAKIIEQLADYKQSSQSDEDCPVEIRYTLKRLITGLSSDRKSARLGFFVALVEVLRSFEIPAGDVYKLSKKCFTKSSRHEMKNALIGQGLVYVSLLRSNCSLTGDQYGEITNEFVKIGTKTKHLEIFASNMLNELFEKVDESLFESSIFPVVETLLSCGWQSASPFIVWLLFVTSRLFPSIVNKNFISKHWEKKSLITTSSFHNLGQLMMTSTSAHPNIHPLCMEILTGALHSKHFNSFWTELVDSKLVGRGKEKTFLVCELLKAVLPELKTVEQVETVLSPHLLQSVISSMANPNQMLYQASNQLLSELVKFVSSCEEPKFQVAVVKKLQTSSASISFDKVTKTRTICSMTTHLKTAAVHELTDFLMDYVIGHNVEQDKGFSDSNRTAAVQQLLSLFNHLAVGKDWEWRTKVIKFLLLHSFFDVKSVDHELLQEFSMPRSITAGLRNSLRKCCFIIVEKMTTKTFSYWKPNFRELFNIYYLMIRFCNSLLKNSALASPVEEFDSETMNCWQHLWKLVKELRRCGKATDDTEASMSSENTTFQVFFLQLMLQLFVNPKEIIPLTSDLDICCKKATEHLKNRQEMMSASVSSDEVELPWVEVVVDILLSFVSKMEQKFFKSIINSVFRMLAPHLTTAALQQIINVVNPNKADDGDDESLMDSEEDSEVETNENRVEEIEDDDVGEMNGTAEEEKESDSSDDKSDSDCDESLCEVDIDAGLLATTLQTAMGGQSDDSDVDLDEVDEAEMERVDKALAEVFKNRKNPKAETEMRDFRLRCMNVLEIIMAAHATVPMICAMIIPVVEVVMNSQKKSEGLVCKKALNLLHQLDKVRTFHVDNINDTPGFFGIWHRLASLADKVKDQEVASVVARASNVLVRCMKKTTSSDDSKEPNLLKELVTKYQDLMESYFVKRNCHPHITFISTFLDRNQDLCCEFADTLLDFAARDDVRIFRRTQALTLLLTNIVNRADILKSWDEMKLKEFTKKFCKHMKKFITEMEDMKKTFATSLFRIFEILRKHLQERDGKQRKLISIKMLRLLRPQLPKDVKKRLKRILVENKKIARAKVEKQEKENEEELSIAEMINEIMNDSKDETAVVSPMKKEKQKQSRSNWSEDLLENGSSLLQSELEESAESASDAVVESETAQKESNSDGSSEDAFVQTIMDSCDYSSRKSGGELKEAAKRKSTTPTKIKIEEETKRKSTSPTKRKFDEEVKEETIFARKSTTPLKIKFDEEVKEETKRKSTSPMKRKFDEEVKEEEETIFDRKSTSPKKRKFDEEVKRKSTTPTKRESDSVLISMHIGASHYHSISNDHLPTSPERTSVGDDKDMDSEQDVSMYLFSCKKSPYSTEKKSGKRKETVEEEDEDEYSFNEPSPKLLTPLKEKRKLRQSDKFEDEDVIDPSPKRFTPMKISVKVPTEKRKSVEQGEQEEEEGKSTTPSDGVRRRTDSMSPTRRPVAAESTEVCEEVDELPEQSPRKTRSKRLQKSVQESVASPKVCESTRKRNLRIVTPAKCRRDAAEESQEEGDEVKGMASARKKLTTIKEISVQKSPVLKLTRIMSVDSICTNDGQSPEKKTVKGGGAVARRSNRLINKPVVSATPIRRSSRLSSRDQTDH